MSEMVERVAKALFEGRQRDSGAAITWESLSELRKDIWRPDAMVAIVAMKVPTEAMKVAGKVALEWADNSGVDDKPDGDEVVPPIWSAMVEEALK